MTLIERARGHLRRNRQTYVQHLLFAGGHGVRCLRAGWYLLIHAIAPCFFERAGSTLVRAMEKDFTEHQAAPAEAGQLLE